MFGYENIQLSIAYSAAYLVIALLLIALYSFYVYRFTIPQIDPLKKTITGNSKSFGITCSYA